MRESGVDELDCPDLSPVEPVAGWALSLRPCQHVLRYFLPSVNVSAFQVTKNGTIGKLFTCGQENQGFVSSPLFEVRVARWVPVRSPRRTPARCISSLMVHGDPLQAPICFLVLLTCSISILYIISVCPQFLFVSF